MNLPEEFLETGIYEGEDHYLLVVPAHVIPNPVSTVGMGDTISSTSFALEYSKER
jgi:ADP-dependent phosphofructokinase/glucokinase